MKINSVTNIKPSPTFFGGPVHLNQGFIIHSNEKKYKTSENILDGVMITSSEEILIDISKDKSWNLLFISTQIASLSNLGPMLSAI